MLTAIAGCTAADVDVIVSKPAEPSRFEVSISAEKVRDEGGNHLSNLVVRFDVAFPADDDGEAAREVMPDAIQRSHDYLCTVSRTVELGTPVQVDLSLPQPQTPGSSDVVARNPWRW